MKRFFKLSVIVVCLMVISWQGRAQQYPVFTQYYFNEMVINPAYAGNHVQLSLTAMYRNQWVNFPGAPKTFNISGHTSLWKKRMGIGLLVDHDEIGVYKNNHIYGSYSYKINFPNATFSMGIQAGFNLLGADYNKLDPQDKNDASFPLSSINTLKPNFGAGLFYNRKNFFVGISVPFILNSTIATNASSIIKEARYYFLRSGAYLPLAKNVKMNPSMLLRTQEGQPLSIDINNAFIFYDVFGVGLSYRSGDAFIVFIDLQLTDQLHFGYSYDLTRSTINKFSNGTHEFMLNYRFKISSVHKNLECPKYYNYR